LAHHYRAPISYTSDLMEQYKKTYDKISYTLNKWNFQFILKNVKDDSMDRSVDEFIKYMDDDFNTPMVVTLLDSLVKELNKSEDKKIFNTLKVLLNVLGITPVVIEPTKDDLKNYMDWNEARLNKDFAKADTLRKLLSEKGWI